MVKYSSKQVILNVTGSATFNHKLYGEADAVGSRYTVSILCNILSIQHSYVYYFLDVMDIILSESIDIS